jgi:hypothetical protein
MLLGLTYAEFVAVVGGSMLAFTPPEHPANKDSKYIVSVGTNAKDKTPVGQDGFVTIESRPSEEILWSLKPLYVAGLSVDGAGFAGVGVRKDYRWKDFQVTPFTGPVLYQQSLRNFESNQLLQFRTGFDVLYNVTPDVGVGVGVYHISNAGITSASAGIDVTRFTVQIKY